MVTVSQSVGSVGRGTHVELTTLEAYLTKQYEGMGGAKIASHVRFCDNAPGRMVLVPVAGLPSYLRAQYAGVGGKDIASHPYFLRNCPKVTPTITSVPSNLARRIAPAWGTP